GTRECNIVHLSHSCGTSVVVAAVSDMYGAFGLLQLCGTAGGVQVRFGDSFHAFKTQLEGFIDYLHTGARPFPFDETVELMKLVIAGLRSRDEGGREVMLEEYEP
ncbi:MAG: oxidoreductase, partial [Patescibacteria group bacterium]|nr:oxidoreductase [Patescibacteria group bacterium]